jgi:hypothetical protein
LGPAAAVDICHLAHGGEVSTTVRPRHWLKSSTRQRGRVNGE